MQVTQLINGNGRPVANQIIINHDNMVTFQSYQTKICTYDKDNKTLKLYGQWWDYSNTTRKHFKTFINDFTRLKYDTKKQFLELIESNDKIIIKE